MPTPSRFTRSRVRRVAALITLTGAALTASVFVGLGLARTFTLGVARNAPVTNVKGQTTRKNIIINGRGFAVYTLSGDSKSHPECRRSNGCFAFWPPVKVSAAHQLTRAAGIKGQLSTWRRDGFLQVVLNGHPLYTFSEDRHRADATGEGLHTFGGTWHVSRF